MSNISDRCCCKYCGAPPEEDCLCSRISYYNDYDDCDDYDDYDEEDE